MSQMLEQFYLDVLSRYLTQDQVITLSMLVWLIQVHKTVKIERLAAHFSLPIKYESRRKRIQRFLKLDRLSVSLLWLPLVQQIIERKYQKGERIYLVLDRTQWQDKNLFMVGVVMGKRAIPIYWQFLDKRGASNLAEQQSIIRPVLKLLKNHEIVILGDREFHSAELASWLVERNIGFVFRQKKSTNIQGKGQDFQELNELDVSQGTRLFLTNIKVSKAHQLTGVSMGIYWKRTYREMGELEPWYLLTNLPNLAETIKAYKKRVGIEAMFKDCKTGGYNLEGSKASVERLTRLVLLIAIAYTHSTLKGQSIRVKNQAEYIGRRRKIKQKATKNSDFWIGLYGSSWVATCNFLRDWVEELMRINSNKLPFYQRGQRAMDIIQQAV
ncbi:MULTISPECIES: IS4 family transposase [unclassified Microcystis]|uniref:IS4 family transposase n=1 Tax=unclassified Microcystis TaxID=2643300 RepID=UPI00258A2037|nr:MULTISPECIES: IS4 family transposase [unclassified Microcystis]